LDVKHLRFADGGAEDGRGFTSLLAGAWLDRVEELDVYIYLADYSALRDIDALVAGRWPALRRLGVFLSVLSDTGLSEAELRQVFEDRFGGVMDQFEIEWLA
jgi:hypothetical protein